MSISLLEFSLIGNISSDTLRERLKEAIKFKDKRALEKSIEESVAAGIFDLQDDIQTARNVADILGGGAGDKLSSVSIRDDLQKAIESKDIDRLEKVIRICEEAAYPELTFDLHEAKNIFENLGGNKSDKKSPIFLRNQLLRDMRKKDPENLKKSIQECEEAGYPELASDLRKARDALESLGGGRGG